MTLLKNVSISLFGIGSYAIYQVFILSSISKFYSTEILGSYVFYFSFTATVFFLSNLGFRQLIVTNDKFVDFNQYLRVRVFLSTCSVFIVFTVGVAIKSEFWELCLLICAIRFLESLSEINYAYFQKSENHGFQSKLLFTKSALSTLIVFGFVFYNLSLSQMLLSIFLVHSLLLFGCEYSILKNSGVYVSIKGVVNFQRNDLLFVRYAFPLGVGLFLINLNLNASRIFSGTFLSDIETAALAATLQLVLVAAPVVTGLCQVFLPKLSKSLKENRHNESKVLFIKLSLFMATLSFSGVLIVYLFGGDILSLLYNDEIANYEILFILGSFGAAFNYLSACSNLVVVALNKHKLQQNIMLTIVLINMLFIIILGGDYGVYGLSVAFLLSSTFRFILLNAYVIYYFMKFNCDKVFNEDV